MSMIRRGPCLWTVALACWESSLCIKAQQVFYLFSRLLLLVSRYVTFVKHNTNNNMTVYMLTVELLGYVGGAVSAMSLLPQLLHTHRTKSTSDISYLFQITCTSGLMINLIYFVLIGATAAFVTVSFEIFLASLLLVMKLRLDGCGPPKINTIVSSLKLDMECGIEELTEDSGSSRSESIDGGYSHTDRVQNVLLDEDFHILTDIRFQIELPREFGETLVTETCRIAALHGVHVARRHVEYFVKSDSEGAGFVASVRLDKSQLSVNCCSDRGKLMFDVLSCGSQSETSRIVGREVHAFLKGALGDDARHYVHHFSRFTRNIPLTP
jgi:MtN3 and saliva related transmembrane protein